MTLIKTDTTIILTEEEANTLLNARDILDAIYEDSDCDDPVEVYAKDARNEIESFLENCDVQVEKKQATKTVLVAIADLN